MKNIEKHFAKAGLPVEVITKDRIPARVRRNLEEGAFFADVTGQGRNERFRIYPGTSKVEVINISKDSPHILIHVDTDPKAGKGTQTRMDWSKRKLLFGHDERHLFVSQLTTDRVSTVKEAIASMRPEAAEGVKLRQGEWFFKPMPDFQVGNRQILKKQALPGAGNQHICDEMVLDVEDSEIDPKTPSWRRRPRFVRDRYVRGKISHPEHSTKDLGNVWHLVIANQETRGRGRAIHDYVD